MANSKAQRLRDDFQDYQQLYKKKSFTSKMNFISFFPSKNYFKEELIYYFPLKYSIRDFPGGPVVKISPSNTGGVGSIPSQGAKIPHASWPKSKTRK